MTTLVVLSVVDIVLLIAGLAFYLFVVGGQLTRVATDLEECADIVWDIKKNAEPIVEGVSNINRVGGVVAGALPLLYGMAEGIVVGATYQPPPSGPPPRRRRAPGGPGCTTWSATRRTSQVVPTRPTWIRSRCRPDRSSALSRVGGQWATREAEFPGAQVAG